MQLLSPIVTRILVTRKGSSSGLGVYGSVLLVEVTFRCGNHFTHAKLGSIQHNQHHKVRIYGPTRMCQQKKAYYYCEQGIDQRWSRSTENFRLPSPPLVFFFKLVYKDYSANFTTILCRSEGPAQIFLLVINWLVAAFGKATRDQWKKIIISYDNMCHLNNLKVAKKPLPLPGDLQYLWLDVNKVIDSLHIHNHKDERCKSTYDPSEVLTDGMNTMSCEQTFAWLSRYLSCLCVASVNCYFLLQI